VVFLNGLRLLLLRTQTARAKGEPDDRVTSHYFGFLYIGYPAVVSAALGMADVMAELLGFSADITLHEIVPLL